MGNTGIIIDGLKYNYRLVGLRIFIPDEYAINFRGYSGWYDVSIVPFKPYGFTNENCRGIIHCVCRDSKLVERDNPMDLVPQIDDASVIINGLRALGVLKDPRW